MHAIPTVKIRLQDFFYGAIGNCEPFLALNQLFLLLCLGTLTLCAGVPKSLRLPVETSKYLMPLSTGFLVATPLSPSFPTSSSHTVSICTRHSRVIIPKARRPKQVSITMVKTASTMLPLGTSAPDFSLVEPLSGNKLSLSDVRRDNGLLVVFMCNHCPFVVLLQDQLRALGSDLEKQSVGVVGISSNDIKDYPQDGPEHMAEMAKTTFSTFPYLLDETQDVAKAYRAACTPDLFLFNKDMKLVYRGQVDDARPGNGVEVTGKSIREAVSLLVEGKAISEDSMLPSIGCNIKWTKGSEPDYFG